MKVLVACEFSGRVSDQFALKGHDVLSCDLLPTESKLNLENLSHYQGDAIECLNENWDLLIAHPPCTYLSNAGARWLYPKGILNEERYQKGLEAKEFFMKFYDSNARSICVENPKPSRIFKLPKHTQKIQPFQFGDPYSKGTLLWLKNLPELKPTKIVEIEGYWAGSFTSKHGKKGRVIGRNAKERSMTFQGIADAMADQWGSDTIISQFDTQAV